MAHPPKRVYFTYFPLSNWPSLLSTSLLTNSPSLMSKEVTLVISSQPPTLALSVESLQEQQVFCASDKEELKMSCATAQSCISLPCPSGTYCFPFTCTNAVGAETLSSAPTAFAPNLLSTAPVEPIEESDGDQFKCPHTSFVGWHTSPDCKGK